MKLQGFGGGVSSPSSSCLLYLCAQRFLFCQIRRLYSLPHSQLLRKIYSTSKPAGTSPSASDLHPVVLEWSCLGYDPRLTFTGGAQRPLNTHPLIPRYGWSSQSRGEFLLQGCKTPPSQPGNNLRPKITWHGRRSSHSFQRYWCSCPKPRLELTRRLANAYKVTRSQVGLIRTIRPSPWNFMWFFVHPSQVTIYVIVSIYFSFILSIVKSYDLSFSAMCW